MEHLREQWRIATHVMDACAPLAVRDLLGVSYDEAWDMLAATGADPAESFTWGALMGVLGGLVHLGEDLIGRRGPDLGTFLSQHPGWTGVVAMDAHGEDHVSAVIDGRPKNAPRSYYDSLVWAAVPVTMRARTAAAWNPGDPETAYRGVPLALDAKHGVPILEALAAGQINVAARLIIDAMAAAPKQRWWSAGNDPDDEAGRWWTSSESDAREYGHSDTDAWMTMPVLMTAEIDSSIQGEQDAQGRGWWHLEPGTPLKVTQFEAVLPVDPKRLLDDWRGVTSEGNFDEPGTHWRGREQVLPIPPMRTTASL